MEKRSWTRQQQIAIDDRGGALLLSAAAGSGKTAVLTQRAADLLAEEERKIPADSLLIVTFTNAAAAELRARMAAALEEKLQANPGSSWLRRQKLLLGKAAICTVDSFCMDLLTQHFTQTELPVGFSVLRPAEEAALREEALAETLEQAYTDPDFCRFASQYGKARSDADAAGAVLRLFDITCAMPYPRQWWGRLQQDWAPGQRPEDTAWGKTILRAAENLLQGIYRRQQQAIELLADVEEAEKRALPILRAELEQTAALLRLARAHDWDGCCLRTQTLTFERMNLPRGMDKTLSGQVRGLRDFAKKMLKELGEKYFSANAAAFMRECAYCQPMVAALERAVCRFAQLFWEKKLELGSFCFYDFEQQALRLLREENGARTPLSLELAKKYAAVMVDEYQDTNDLQDALYSALANPEGSNLFFVGDVKQSIYGFRDARPEHFIQKKENYAAYDGAHYPATVLLSSNFRSTGAVIGCVNDIFTPLISRETGGVSYDAAERLVPGFENYPLDAPCEVWMTDLTPPEEPAAPPAPAELLVREAQQPDDRYTVAQKIADMLHSGTPVRCREGLRPCRAGDFCILLRSPNQNAQKYADALHALGIPTFCRSQDALLDDPQVDLLLSFLRVLDNPGQDIPLTAVLLSPVFGFTPQNLVDIRLAHRKGSLYAALLHSTLPGAAAFLARLRRLRRQSLGLPVQDICALILDDTGLYELTGALPGAESSRQNLRLFQSVAAQYAGSNGLSGFLRLVDTAVKNGRALTDQRGQNAPADRVQIMSIHGSKGLEFPIVILAGAHHKFNFQDEIGNFLCDSTLGIAFKLLREDAAAGTRQLVPSLAIRAIALKKRQELVGEEMRLLYVALTRAQDRLILSWAEKTPLAAVNAAALAVSDGAPDLTELQTTSRTMSHWLLLALLLHPDFQDLWTEVALPQPRVRFGAGGHFTFARIPYAKPDPTAQAADFTAQPDPALLCTLQKNIGTPAPPPIPLPVKVSVSSLAHREGEAALPVPAFLQKQEKSAAQRGTAMHRFLQLADFSAACKDLDGELNRLTEGAFLAREEVAVLNKAALTRFLHSGLVQRMLGADTLLREYEFIDRIPAVLTDAGLAGTPAEREPVFLLGIADCIILKNGTAELVDYKTDRGKTAAQLLEAYAAQLRLYRAAIVRRLQLPVVRTVIYSLALGEEIEVP